jgi:hypothetical protein
MRWPQAALLCLLIGVHVAILLLPPQAPRHARRARSETTLPITLPPPSQAKDRAAGSTPRIDWDSEASITAEHQAQLASAPKPRLLDDHEGHGDHRDGVGLNSHYAPEFG